MLGGGSMSGVNVDTVNWYYGITPPILVERRKMVSCFKLETGRVRSKEKSEKHRNLASPRTHHEIHRSPATATTSRKRATKKRLTRYPILSRFRRFRVCRTWLRASLVISKNHECHTSADRRNRSIMGPCTHHILQGLFRPKGKERPHLNPWLTALTWYIWCDISQRDTCDVCQRDTDRVKVYHRKYLFIPPVVFLRMV